MSPFEYIIPLISVLIGLAITDIGTSLHKLLRARNRVQWDWLTLTSAFFALVIIIRLWWGLYGLVDLKFYQTLGGFLTLVATLFILYLISAAVLPDNVPRKGLDMKAFYEHNNSYVWALLSVYILTDIVAMSARLTLGDWEFSQIVVRILPNAVTMAFFISLVIIKKRIYHAIVVIALCISTLVFWHSLRLGAI